NVNAGRACNDARQARPTKQYPVARADVPAESLTERAALLRQQLLVELQVLRVAPFQGVLLGLAPRRLAHGLADGRVLELPDRRRELVDVPRILDDDRVVRDDLGHARDAAADDGKP